MRRLRGIAVLAGIGLLVVGCGGGDQGGQTTTTTATTTTKVVPPVAEGALKGLLLSPEEINTAMGTTDMAVTETTSTMVDYADTMQPRECLVVNGAAEAQVYADSGFMAVRDQELKLQEDSALTHYAEQAVILFPSAKQAETFFTTSVDQWKACHSYTHTQSGSDWTAEPPSNTNGMLSTTAAQQNAGPHDWACGRALTARNNVVVNVNTCSADPKNSAVDIANQIAAKVPAG